VFAAEPAVLVHFKSVRIVLLVFRCIVISLLALAASQCDSDSHLKHSYANSLNFRIKKNARKAIKMISYRYPKVKYQYKKSQNSVTASPHNDMLWEDLLNAGAIIGSPESGRAMYGPGRTLSAA